MDNRLIIIGSRADSIKRDIETQLTYDVRAYNTINEVYREIEKIPMACNIMLIMDDGVIQSPDDYYSGTSTLKKLVQFPTLKVDRYLYLSYSFNQEVCDKVSFILEQFKDKSSVVDVRTAPDWKLMKIKEAILHESKDRETQILKSEIIIKPRGAVEVKTREVTEMPHATPKITKHYLASESKQTITNKKRIEINPDAEQPELGEDVDISDSDKDILRKIATENKRIIQERVIAVTGCRGSGITTTAMTLANTLADSHKVLMIDINNNNLSLSLSAVKSDNPKICSIPLYQIVENRRRENPIDRLKEISIDMGNKPLHVLSLHKSMMDLESLDFLLLNIIEGLRLEYSYVILDIPNIELHQELCSIIDLILICTAPFAPNVEELKKKMKLISNLDKRKVLIRTGIPTQLYGPCSKEYIMTKLELHANEVTGVLLQSSNFLNNTLLEILKGDRD